MDLHLEQLNRHHATLKSSRKKNDSSQMDVAMLGMQETILSVLQPDDKAILITNQPYKKRSNSPFFVLKMAKDTWVYAKKTSHGVVRYVYDLKEKRVVKSTPPSKEDLTSEWCKCVDAWLTAFSKKKAVVFRQKMDKK